MLRQGLHHALEGREGVGSRVISRALGYLPGYHCRPQRPFGPIVGRLNSGVLKEPQQALSP